MDIADLDRLLGIDITDPAAARSRSLIEADAGLLDDLIAMRLSKGLKQHHIAERMGVSQSAVARIEGGERDPRLSTLRRYALAVGALVEHEVIDDELTEVRSPAASHMQIAMNWPAPDRRVESPEKISS